MMHITYTNRPGSYTWDELCCLSRALGFQANTLNNCIPFETRTAGDGISHKEILKLIELKCFNDVTDRTFNMHTAEYNINVLKKSLKLIGHHLLSFSELNDVRIAFQLYEAADMRGMPIDQHTLMRALKLCNRTVAPLKLMHRVKHLQEFFDEPERIQFYEFLDLLVLCNLIQEVEVANQNESLLEKTEQELYELVDVKKVCTTLDEKIEGQLNSLFVRTERDYGKVHLGDKRIPRESAVDTADRKKRVRQHGARYRELQNHIDHSTQRVLRTKAGHIRDRTVSAPSVDQTDCGDVHVQQRPHTVDQTVQHNFSRAGVCLRLRPFSAPVTSLKEPSPPSVKEKTLSTAPSKRSAAPRAALYDTYLEYIQNRKDIGSRTGLQESFLQQDPQVTQNAPHRSTQKKTKPQTPQVVTTEKVEERQDILDNLQYEIQTLEERTIKHLYTDLNKIYPTYRERRLLEKSKIKPEQEVKKVKRKAKKANPEAFKRLTKPRPRAFLAVHDGNCDARFVVSGLKQNDRHNRGRQILTANSHTSSICLDRLPKTRRDDGGRNDGGRNDGGRNDGGSISSADESSLKTLDVSRHSWFSNHFKASHTQMQDFDRGKYKDTRIGTAAVLFDHFHGGDNTSVSNQIYEANDDKNDVDLNFKTDNDSIDLELLSTKSDSRAPSADILHALLNNDCIIGSNYQSVDPRSAQREKAQITQRLNSYDDDELKINGVLLSEFDKLTIKQEMEKLPTAKRRSLPTLATPS